MFFRGAGAGPMVACWSWLLVFVVAYHFLKPELRGNFLSRFHISSHSPARGLEIFVPERGWETLHMCYKLGTEWLPASLLMYLPPCEVALPAWFP